MTFFPQSLKSPVLGCTVGYYICLPIYTLLKLENVFVKDYAPNHMPDPKGEWSLKENNSALNYGICSKVKHFIYTLVCNYMPNIRILANAALQIYRSQGCSYTKCLCPEAGVAQPKIYGIDLKVNKFIFTLVCNYIPNIRNLAKAALQLFCSQGCSYNTKCLCLKKESNATENLRNRFKS